MPETSEHFVAHLKIERVERKVDSTLRTAPGGGKSERVVDEVTQMVIKAPSLASLITRVRAHMAIMNDTHLEEP